MTETLSLVGALSVGLLGGVHCVGMCGGIVGAMTITMPEQKPLARLPVLLGYNAGRLMTYTLAGALFGGIGQLSAPLFQIQVFQSLLALIAAVMMIFMGLYLGGWSYLLRHVERVGGLLWKRLEPFGCVVLPVRHPMQAALLGMLWGWLPCGLVYSMLIWALGSGSSVDGALLLFAFGLGTLPNLLATGLLLSQFTRFVQQAWVRRMAAILLIFFGFYTLTRALSGSL